MTRKNKTCTRCKTKKPISNFYTYKHKDQTKHFNHCKQCHNRKATDEEVASPTFECKPEPEPRKVYPQLPIKQRPERLIEAVVVERLEEYSPEDALIILNRERERVSNANYNRVLYNSFN